MSALPKTITATIAPQAIEKATRFYTSGLKDVLVELLQNSRRANATQIHIHHYDNKIIIHDNGDGIKDPSTILTFGRSEWADDTTETEDAAGMGFFSLSGRKCKIISQHIDALHGWKASLTPDSFSGKKPVSINKFGTVDGTIIEFSLDELNDTKNILNQITSMSTAFNQYSVIEKICKYFPIPVTYFNKTKTSSLKSQIFEPEDFLKDAIDIHETDYGRIGVFKDAHFNHNINFHGCTLNTTLPQIGSFGKWKVRIDVNTAEKIKLVLPSRKEVVSNNEWQNVLNDCTLKIYETIAKQPYHNLTYAEYKTGLRHGIKLNESLPRLEKWTASIADHHNNCSGNYMNLSRVENPIILQHYEDDPAMENHFEYILERDRSWNRTILRPDISMKGYKWYDNLTTVLDVYYTISKDDHTAKIHNLNNDEALLNGQNVIDFAWIDKVNNPDSITAHFELSDGNLHETVAVFLPIGEPDEIDELTLLFTEVGRKTVDVSKLTRYLTYAYFDPSDDDGYDSQLEYFEQCAKELIRKHLYSDIEVKKMAIRDEFLKYITYSIPYNHDLTINYKSNNNPHRDVDIIFTPTKTDNPIKCVDETTKWAEAIASRIADESRYDSDDKSLLENALVQAFKASPEAAQNLVGTGIIEDDYFDSESK